MSDCTGFASIINSYYWPHN